MIALLLVVGVVLYIVLAVVVTLLIRRAFKTGRAKTVATIVSLLAFILIPTADDFAGKWYFDHLCEKEAGAKTFKSVEGVKGMLDPGLAPSDLEAMSYEFMEWKFIGKYYRVKLDSRNKEPKQEIDRPTSRYEVKRGEWRKVQLNVNKYEESIVDSQTNEELGRYTTFSYGGGWVSDVLRSWGLSGGLSCQLPPNTHKAFYLNTLKPLVPNTLNK